MREWELINPPLGFKHVIDRLHKHRIWKTPPWGCWLEKRL